jgi:thiamine-phosphate pyrophosphorylase
VLRHCVVQALTRLATPERSPTVATEHLLLGIAAGDDDVALWLREQGLDPEALTREIESLYGVSHETVPMPVVEANGAGHALAAQSPAVDAARPLVEEASKVAVGEHASRAPHDVSALRLLDAAANRAREGLRVVEDYARFVRNDGFLMAELKQLRHDLAMALARLPADKLLACRDTLADVGTSVTTAGETSRADPSAVATANFKRSQEALRSLEEFGKLVDPLFAAEVEQLRYRSYTLERVAHLATRSQARLSDARLYVLIDGRETLEQFEALTRKLIEAGVHVLQLRDKRLDDRELLGRAARLRESTRGTPTLFILNDRPDLAVLAEADGVHVGQEELTVKDARRLVGPEMLVGVSTHSIQQARQAVLDGADYLGLGPTFPSGTKRFDRFPGLDFLRQAAAEITLPAFAIGGINLENLPQVLAAGIRRVAVGQAITEATVPATAARRMLAALD